MGTDDAAGGRLASETDHPPSLAERSLCRHTPEVGAVCGKAARTVLCGGRAVKRASLPLPASGTYRASGNVGPMSALGSKAYLVRSSAVPTLLPIANVRVHP